jgi:hypothetical protein
MGYEDEYQNVAPEDRSDFQKAAQLRNLLADPDLAAKPDLVSQASAAVEADLSEKSGVKVDAVDVAATLSAAQPVAAKKVGE